MVAAALLALKQSMRRYLLSAQQDIKTGQSENNLVAVAEKLVATSAATAAAATAAAAAWSIGFLVKRDYESVEEEPRCCGLLGRCCPVFRLLRMRLEPLLPRRGVEAVLDSVLGPAGKKLGDLAPSGAEEGLYAHRSPGV